MWLREMENTGYLKVGIDLYKILRYWSFFQINWFKIDLIPFFADQGESSSVVEGDILTLSPIAGGSQDTMVGLSQSSTATPIVTDHPAPGNCLTGYLEWVQLVLRI